MIPRGDPHRLDGLPQTILREELGEKGSRNRDGGSGASKPGDGGPVAREEGDGVAPK